MSDVVENARLPKAEFLQAINKLNRELAGHAMRKELKQGMALFDEAMSKGWANSHTYAAAINCNVRCGNMKHAARLLEKLKSHGKGIKADVIHYTTVMKGYCEQGDMSSAQNVLNDMCLRRVVPNVRTVNTFLRGCMQTGSLAAGERIVQCMAKDFQCTPDVSSWEYLIVLLCQGLQLPKVYPIIGRLKADPEMQSGLSSMHVNMARAAALLGEHKACRRSLQAALEAVAIDEHRAQQQADVMPAAVADDGEEVTGAGTTSSAQGSSSSVASGGKRAWKEEQEGSSRDRSLLLFREHKASELRQEVELIGAFNDGASKGGPHQLLPSFLRVLCLHTQGNENDSELDPMQLGIATVESLTEGLLLRLGLDAFLAKFHSASNAIEKVKVQAKDSALKDEDKKKDKKAKKRALAEAAAVVEKSPLLALPIARVELVRALMRTYVSDNGHFIFENIFSDQSSNELISALSVKPPKNNSNISNNTANPMGPLKLEICSGTGEWAVTQAKADPQSNYVTLELRHDRVYQAFYRGICANISNLCAIAGDANTIVSKHLQPDSMENIFINHPEPPQQYGGEESQGKHLLTIEFFNAIANILKPGGMITVVTDNEWYSKFLVKLLALAPHPRALSNVELRGLDDCKPFHEEGSFVAYRGKTGPAVGHMTDASSYFDRLWKRGNLVERYIIVLKKAAGDTSALRIRQYKKGAAPKEMDATMPKAKKIKFDDDD
jgi:pentatricopeptide repeat protein